MFRVWIATAVSVSLQNCGAGEAFSWKQVCGGRTAQLPDPSKGSIAFHKVEHCGIDFTNALPAERLLENQVRYGGAGVAAGDIDGDGWCDLFFCSLEGCSHLYKNLGEWKFREITEQAGVSLTGLFTSGAVLADVEGDGDLDLLINAYGGGTRLFLNAGDGRFSEKKDSGLVQRYGATSLALSDVDGDGTLDLYVATYSTTALADKPGTQFTVQRVGGKLTVMSVDGVRVQGNPELQNRFLVDPETGTILQTGEPDIFYRNKGNGVFEPQAWTGGQFLDETGKPLSEAQYDWGLSVMCRDFTGDGLPDLYVCNDLFTPDRIWINQGEGRFRAASRLAFRHISDSSMGMDIADINRDGIADLLVLEMLSRDHKLRRTEVVGLRSDISVPGQIDNRPMCNRNTLFLGRGDGTFAEIAYLAGLEASEWSWMPAFLDVDLDGYEDVLITTGYFRDSLNADLHAELQRRRGGKRLSSQEQLKMQREVYPLHRRPNIAFHNRGDLTFEETGERWGFNELGISQGLCLADLDNDGDLDVIFTNFGSTPSVLRNDAAGPRVTVRLKGLPPNTRGIGARISFQGGPVAQSQEMICGGRYLSCDEAQRVFATSTNQGPFTLEVSWRSGRHSVLTNILAGSICEIDEAQAQLPASTSPLRDPNSTNHFADVSHLLNHTHRELVFDDFARQPLLSRKLSQPGPALSWADVNEDGWTDLLIGAGSGGTLTILTNNGKGGFAASNVPQSRACGIGENAGIVVIPCTNGALVLAAQSNYEMPASNALISFCLAQGGNMVQALPAGTNCPGPLALGDVDNDGYLDLFVGGRAVAGQYPAPASSQLFKGLPTGGFGVYRGSSAWFKDLGLVNGAVFSDLDGDGWLDLVVALDWGPVRVFHNGQGKFREITRELGLDGFTGWWNGVTTGDYDQDGRMDIAASNWGRNTRYQAHRSTPLRTYYGNWCGAEALDLLEAFDEPGLKKSVPTKGFDPVRQALPWTAARFATYAAYGEASVQDVLDNQFSKSVCLQACTLESMVFLNRGLRFEAKPLPIEAQFAPAFGIATADLDGDGTEDLFLAQNFYPVDAENTRLDAGRGLWLRGDGRGNFSAVPGQVSGLAIYGDQRSAAFCDYDQDGCIDLAVSQNGSATKLYHNEGARPGLRVKLAGSLGNSAGFGAQLRLIYASGPGPVREVHAGSGYWSQDCPVQVLGKKEPPVQLWVRWSGGKQLTYSVPPAAREVIVDHLGNIATRPEPGGMNTPKSPP